MNKLIKIKSIQCGMTSIFMHRSILNFIENIQEGIDCGFIGENGAPLRCGCGNSEFHSDNTWYEDYCRVEYDLICNSCGTKVGYWAYGSFDPGVIFW